MDKYDKAVAYLKDNPEEIANAWFNGSSSDHGCLFQFLEERDKKGPTGKNLGCLTQIKLMPNSFEAPTKKLTEGILNDDRIPSSDSAINTGNLEVFAEWQRRVDKELGRT